MSLQDRLEAARISRRAEAGLPASPAVRTDPQPGSGPAQRPIETHPVIDLRDKEIIRELSHAPSFSSALAVSGSGDVCPSCGGATRLDLVDTLGGVDHFACVDCQLLFQAAHVAAAR